MQSEPKAGRSPNVDRRSHQCLDQAESWRDVLRRAHADLVEAITAVDPGSPGTIAQIERAQRAMAAVQLTRLRYLPHPGSA
jgi:hypothetical protein